MESSDAPTSAKSLEELLDDVIGLPKERRSVIERQIFGSQDGSDGASQDGVLASQDGSDGAHSSQKDSNSSQKDGNVVTDSVINEVAQLLEEEYVSALNPSGTANPSSAPVTLSANPISTLSENSSGNSIRPCRPCGIGDFFAHPVASSGAPTRHGIPSGACIMNGIPFVFYLPVPNTSAAQGIQHPSASLGIQHPSAALGVQHPSAASGFPHLFANPSAASGFPRLPKLRVDANKSVEQVAERKVEERLAKERNAKKRKEEKNVQDVRSLKKSRRSVQPMRPVQAVGVQAELLAQLADFLDSLRTKPKQSRDTIDVLWDTFWTKFGSVRETFFGPMQVIILQRDAELQHHKNKFKHLKLWFLVLFAHFSDFPFDKKEENCVQITFDTSQTDAFFTEHHPELFNMHCKATHWISEFVSNSLARVDPDLVSSLRMKNQPTVHVLLTTRK